MNEEQDLTEHLVNELLLHAGQEIDNLAILIHSKFNINNQVYDTPLVIPITFNTDNLKKFSNKNDDFLQSKQELYTKISIYNNKYASCQRQQHQPMDNTEPLRDLQRAIHHYDIPNQIKDKSAKEIKEALLNKLKDKSSTCYVSLTWEFFIYKPESSTINYINQQGEEAEVTDNINQDLKDIREHAAQMLKCDPEFIAAAYTKGNISEFITLCTNKLIENINALLLEKDINFCVGAPINIIAHQEIIHAYLDKNEEPMLCRRTAEMLLSKDLTKLSNEILDTLGTLNPIDNEYEYEYANRYISNIGNILQSTLTTEVLNIFTDDNEIDIEKFCELRKRHAEVYDILVNYPELKEEYFYENEIKIIDLFTEYYAESDVSLLLEVIQQIDINDQRTPLLGLLTYQFEALQASAEHPRSPDLFHAEVRRLQENYDQFLNVNNNQEDLPWPISYLGDEQIQKFMFIPNITRLLSEKTTPITAELTDTCLAAWYLKNHENITIPEDVTSIEAYIKSARDMEDIGSPSGNTIEEYLGTEQLQNMQSSEAFFNYLTIKYPNVVDLDEHIRDEIIIYNDYTQALQNQEFISLYQNTLPNNIDRIKPEILIKLYNVCTTVDTCLAAWYLKNHEDITIPEDVTSIEAYIKSDRDMEDIGSPSGNTIEEYLGTEQLQNMQLSEAFFNYLTIKYPNVVDLDEHIRDEIIIYNDYTQALQNQGFISLYQNTLPNNIDRIKPEILIKLYNVCTTVDTCLAAWYLKNHEDITIPEDVTSIGACIKSARDMEDIGSPSGSTIEEYLNTTQLQNMLSSEVFSNYLTIKYTNVVDLDEHIYNVVDLDEHIREEIIIYNNYDLALADSTFTRFCQKRLVIENIGDVDPAMLTNLYTAYLAVDKNISKDLDKTRKIFSFCSVGIGIIAGGLLPLLWIGKEEDILNLIAPFEANSPNILGGIALPTIAFLAIFATAYSALKGKPKAELYAALIATGMTGVGVGGTMITLLLQDQLHLPAEMFLAHTQINEIVLPNPFVMLAVAAAVILVIHGITSLLANMKEERLWKNEKDELEINITTPTHNE